MPLADDSSCTPRSKWEELRKKAQSSGQIPYRLACRTWESPTSDTHQLNASRSWCEGVCVEAPHTDRLELHGTERGPESHLLSGSHAWRVSGWGVGCYRCLLPPGRPPLRYSMYSSKPHGRANK
jgi:hypothetical protein